MMIDGDWFSVLRDQLHQLDLIQLLVLVFGVLQVLLARANNVLLYPAGIVATGLAVYTLFEVKLYAESFLQVYYLVMSVYGWWNWTDHHDKTAARVRPATVREWLTTGVIVFGGWFILYLLLVTFTDSDVPLWDAWVSATAWAGMWLLARRRTENWILLNISNAFAIPLLFRKELPLFALLTIFLFVVACFGYFDWRRIARREQASLTHHDA